jgi:hypothetical protein
MEDMDGRYLAFDGDGGMRQWRVEKKRRRRSEYTAAAGFSLSARVSKNNRV